LRSPPRSCPSPTAEPQYHSPQPRPHNRAPTTTTPQPRPGNRVPDNQAPGQCGPSFDRRKLKTLEIAAFDSPCCIRRQAFHVPPGSPFTARWRSSPAFPGHGQHHRSTSSVFADLGQSSQPLPVVAGLGQSSPDQAGLSDHHTPSVSFVIVAASRLQAVSLTHRTPSVSSVSPAASRLQAVSLTHRTPAISSVSLAASRLQAVSLTDSSHPLHFMLHRRREPVASGLFDSSHALERTAVRFNLSVGPPLHHFAGSAGSLASFDDVADLTFPRSRCLFTSPLRLAQSRRGISSCSVMSVPFLLRMRAITPGLLVWFLIGRPEYTAWGRECQKKIEKNQTKHEQTAPAVRMIFRQWLARLRCRFRRFRPRRRRSGSFRPGHSVANRQFLCFGPDSPVLDIQSRSFRLGRSVPILLFCGVSL
jgi:hypothetical protein